MVSDAVMLMFVGMGVVFVFLALLNIFISLLTYCTRKHTRNEETTLAKAELARRKKKFLDTGDSDIQTAVISAAIHAYKST